MKTRILTFAMSALGLGLAIVSTPAPGSAQPLNDKIHVNLPYSVTIGGKTLQPGEYEIKELPSQSGKSEILTIFGNNGMKFEATAMTIPALEGDTQRHTRVILHHIGNDYYFDKVWIQGKDYGYEFPLPDAVRRRESEASQGVTVTASNTNTNDNSNASATAQTVQQDQSATQSATPVTPTPMPVQQPVQQPVEQPVQQQDPQPQAVTPPPVMSQPTTTPDMTPTTPTTPANSADRAMTEPNDTASMPSTADGWLLMLLGGAVIAGAGLTLQRKLQ